ncbi:hypothetical protein ACFL2V_11410 [Pseudomonadota bacterium]
MDYKVEVEGAPNITSRHAAFNCEIRDWNPTTDEKGDYLGEIKVNSDLGDAKSEDAYNDVENMLDNDELISESNPDKPDHIPEPKKRVRDLNSFEAMRREMGL